MLKKLISRIKSLYYLSNSERYCDFLRSRGVRIGENNHLDPKSSVIDLTRPSLISIGSNCYMNSDFKLLTHDWVSSVFINSGREFLPSSGRVTIGNNVGFGQNVMILKGVSIGDNCFIGAGSIVTKSIPANSIAAGIPCKVIMSLEEYYQKRRKECVDEALDYARSIQDSFSRPPTISDFWEEFPLFVDGDKISHYPELAPIIKRQCGISYDNYCKSHKAEYDSFDEFLQAAGLIG